MNTGKNGPADYGFGSVYNIPTPNTLPTGCDYFMPYPSPNGFENESTGGDNLNGGVPKFVYQTNAGDPDAGDPFDVNANTLDIRPPSFVQLSDAAIYHAFHDYWLNSPQAATPWFLAVSFVGTHDITSFPWAFGLASNLNGQACGTGPNDFGCCSNGATVGFYPPPIGGWTDNYISTNIISFNALPLLYNANSNPPPNWNNSESPESLPYGSAGGKPGLQDAFQRGVNKQSGTINTDYGWNTFLNYYYWLHRSADILIGLVVHDIRSQFPYGEGHDPIIIFTSDHGDFGGSHSLHSKGGPLYDEVMNVPLLIHTHNQAGYYTRPFLCSSVDILPFVYSISLGNESWRSNPNDMVSYLNNRESIFDSVLSNAADSRRLAPYTNYGGFGATGGQLPFVLHTCDEFSSATDNTGNSAPSHAIAFRTLDNSVVYYDSNTGTNFYGGGKLGIYTNWLGCTTYPDTSDSSKTPPQFEYYDYYSNNYGELGNNAFNSPWIWNSNSAGLYLNSYNNIMAQELYHIDPKFQNAFNNAFNAYMDYLNDAGFQGGGDSCAYNVGLINYMAPPA